jgi:phosphoglycolate phosphatase-like HAD superfamily hydrolase
MSNDPLPSWNDGPNKQAILDFVAAVTEEGGERFVPEADRIATFDNDGCLWVEQPLYVQGFFALDQIKALAPQHPEWQTEQPFAAILAGDAAAMKQFSEEDVGKILAATHTGMTTDQFDEYAERWIATAKHPRYDRLFTETIYQPQLELLDYLRANSFQTFIVSGGGVDFLRTFAERTYGVPPSQTVGSSAKVTYAVADGAPTLTKQPEVNSIDDKDGKPVNIHLHIGQKPILAFGNSDGDQQMLEYTDQGDGPRLMLLVHHDDAEREYAYDRDSKIGKLDTAWDEAVKRGWIVVSMKDDWGKIFPFTPAGTAGNA